MKFRFPAFLLCVLCFGFAFNAKASHIVGGEMTYIRIAGTNTYNIQLLIYQDCVTGNPAAISEDNPGFFGVYIGSNLISAFQIPIKQTITVPPNFNNSCVLNAPRTCLKRAMFTFQVTLDNPLVAHRIVYQRCCRNVTIRNIRRPGEIGATYFCDIPPAPDYNNSAVFQNFPPQIICVDNPLVYDHSADDIDGDSLSYEFCQVYTGGSADTAKPSPPPFLRPLIPVTYLQPYVAVNPMGGFPRIKIDPVTGIITGTPNTLGRFVVGVCCKEWRNGVVINEMTREFQFVVTDCSKAVVANIPQFSEEINTYIVECKTRTVNFVNISTGGFEYHWDFGVAGTEADTSNEFEPSFIYPDTGVYVVKLVVNKGSTCPDSISRFVKVFPRFDANFSIIGRGCPLTPQQFIDLSVATFPPVISWEWDFGDSTTSFEKNPVHSYDTGSPFRVRLIATTVKGCIDTVFKDNFVEKFLPFAGNDTTIVKGERIDFRATGGAFYQWTPFTNLNFPNVANPTGFYPEPGQFNYYVSIQSANGCSGGDSIKVNVVNQGSLFVPSGFTPNGDGLNDYLRPIGIGYKKINFFRVYNRFGAEVFNTIRFEEGWDGTYHGKAVDVGVYYYQLSITNRFGREEFIKGDVTLLR